MQRFLKIFLFFEDLNADQIWSDDLSCLDDLITLEFPSDFGGLLTFFCGILDRLEGVSIQSHFSFDLSAIRSSGNMTFDNFIPPIFYQGFEIKEREALSQSHEHVYFPLLPRAILLAHTLNF